MCMEDVRIGRKTARNWGRAGATATAALLINQDHKRFSLMLDNRGPNDVFIGFDPSVTALTGMRLAVGDPPLRLKLKDDGRIVTDGLHAICTAAETATVLFWETTLEDE